MREVRDTHLVSHPSGWWKARDGKWYRPDQEPAPEAEKSGDFVTALSIAVGAVVVGSLLPWSVQGTAVSGNLTLLLGGIAGALVAGWSLFSRDAKLLTASAALCAAASVVLVLNVAVLSSSHPQSGVFVATVGALMATILAFTVARRPSVQTV
jgi:hypothetical protein